jgi:hypothetical protein
VRLNEQSGGIAVEVLRILIAVAAGRHREIDPLVAMV